MKLFDYRHKWFDSTLNILDIKDENSIPLDEAIIIYANRGNKGSKIPTAAKSQLCNAIIAVYMKSQDNNTHNPKREVIIHLKQYKQVFFNVAFAFKNSDYFVILISAKYANNNFNSYLIYENDTAADQLSSPLHVISIMENRDILTGTRLNENEDNFSFEFSDTITLYLDKATLNVTSCHMNTRQRSNLKSNFFKEQIQKFDSIINKAEETSDSFRRGVTRANIFHTGKRGGFYIEESESLWLSKLLSFDSHRVSEFIDKLLLSRKKEAVISIGNEEFEVIDVNMIEGSLIVIRTTFRTDSSQLVLLFVKEDDEIKTKLAALIDVFPHEGESSNEYSKSNIIQGASRPGVIASTHVTVSSNKTGQEYDMVNEDIYFKYNYYEVRFSDTILVSDSEEDFSEQNEKETSEQNNTPNKVNEENDNSSTNQQHTDFQLDRVNFANVQPVRNSEDMKTKEGERKPPSQLQSFKISP